MPDERAHTIELTPVPALMEARLGIAAIVGVLRVVQEGEGRSRETSLAITHLETGMLWLREACELADDAETARL